MGHDLAGQKVLAQFRAARFIETTAADYKPVLDYANHIGLDLTTHMCVNN